MKYQTSVRNSKSARLMKIPTRSLAPFFYRFYLLLLGDLLLPHSPAATSDPVGFFLQEIFLVITLQIVHIIDAYFLSLQTFEI